MQKKLHKIFLPAILCAAFSCATPTAEPHLLSSHPEIRNLEREDHKSCLALDLNSGSTNKTFSDDLYWHCRLSMAKYKLQTHVRSTQSLNYNAEITNLINKISERLSTTHESFFTKENKRIDVTQHAKCVAMGYDFDVLDRTKTDQYLLCRKRLIDDNQLDPAYGVEEYLKYPNRSYNLSFVLDNRIDSENKRYSELQKNYPSCLKYFNDTKNLDKCTAAQDQSRQCFSEIDAKKFRKEAEQKTICQKQAYIRFPDSFLKEADQKQLDIKRAKINADTYNQNNFGALGLENKDVELFESEETADAEYEKRKKQKKMEKNINSKKGLYSRYGLTRLRQKYIIACQQDANDDIKKYVEDLKKECADIGEYKEKDNLI